MAVDVFLKIDGIPGESTDAKHLEWIEVLSFSHGMTQAATAASLRGSSGGGGSSSGSGDTSRRGDDRVPTRGRADHQDFRVTKVVDKATPLLAARCNDATLIREVTVEFCRATGGDKQKFMEYKMWDVLVSSVRPSGSGHGSEHLPVEEVSFNYGKIQLAYTPTDPRTGVPRGEVQWAWDRSINSTR